MIIIVVVIVIVIVIVMNHPVTCRRYHLLANHQHHLQQHEHYEYFTFYSPEGHPGHVTM